MITAFKHVSILLLSTVAVLGAGIGFLTVSTILSQAGWQ